MSSKSMVAINPQISLTIGNAEIVNMLVQEQVAALQAEVAELEEISKKNFEVLDAGILEIVQSMDADFHRSYGKKLDAYAKARGALTGHKLSWKSPYAGPVNNYEKVGFGGICVKRYRNGGYRDLSALTPWTEEDEAELKRAKQLEFNLVEIPTLKELNEWDQDWRENFETREEAEASWSEDNSERGGLYLWLKFSEATINLVKKYRAVDNEGFPIMKRLTELRALLADTANVEKAVLAKMTQNTLKSNPELIQAFSVLTEGVLGPPYLETKQLTVEAE